MGLLFFLKLAMSTAKEKINHIFMYLTMNSVLYEKISNYACGRMNDVMAKFLYFLPNYL